ncbi:hypothetical protein ATY78_12200 [Rhizobium sp. R635]|uniref:hypothetical protein n=1 Tax=Rhizobium sp. R635 TaxID=1764275 RepID=UPI000B530315|nr:hypothetical protein [Rhizobium sp. R635]OWV78852.1 hypothetical protein ATY78_12200 [Rhizobium sp. R635]
MLITDRDCQEGGARFAVPTFGEIEGKLLVCEVVATSCLRQLLTHSGAAAVPVIKRRVRRLLEARCEGEKLCRDDTEAAVEYAFQLVEAAAEAAGKKPRVSRTADGCDAIRRLRAVRAPQRR